MISKQQARMLEMFEIGWAFKLFNDHPGSWCTYWSLVKRKLIKDRKHKIHAGKPVCLPLLTDLGKQELLKFKEKNP